MKPEELRAKGYADWRITFEAPVRTRVLHRFIGIEATGSDGGILWWDSDNRRWRSDDEIAWGKNNPERDYCLSSCSPCRSLKAFKRHLRRHSAKLAGCKVRLVSRFIGYDVTATKESPTHDH